MTKLFSNNQDSKSFRITPLGAALVEAMPDRKKMARIRRDCRNKGKCPASALFTQEEANQWARKQKETTP